MRIKRKFDERQLILEGQVIKHAFYVLLFLLTADITLAVCDVTWAVSRDYSNMIIVVTAVAVLGVEAIFREVFVEYKWERLVVILIFLAPIVTFTRVIIWGDCADCENYRAFIADGALTERGSFLVFAAIFSVIPAAFIIKYARDKLKKQSGEEY